MNTGDRPATSEGEDQRGPLGRDGGVRGDHQEEVLGHGDDGQDARHGPEDVSEELEDRVCLGTSEMGCFSQESRTTVSKNEIMGVGGLRNQF